MLSVTRHSPIVRTPRVLQLEGLFDLPPAAESALEWRVDLPLAERDWSLGLIVGPSGCGKTTVAQALFGERCRMTFDWPCDRSLLDGFPASLGIKEVTGLLSSVGFSSPPSWLRPFRVLSNGEQFRANLARALSENTDLVVIDEFTSVVDRTVARVGSAAVAKAVRQRGQRLVAVTCHYDVLDWLQPDWVFEPASNHFSWRSVRRCPHVCLDISRVDRRAWRVFRAHHYLNTDLNPAAHCFLGCVEGSPAAFTAVLSFPHPRRPGWREHRTVCLPDFQGIGIGTAMSNTIASVFRARGPYFSVTSHPAFIAARKRSPHWRLTRDTSLMPGRQAGLPKFERTSASRRLTASFEYIGPPWSPRTN